MKSSKKPFPAIAGFRDDRLYPHEARYWRDGVTAPEDYRYNGMYEYLKLSPSFIAVLDQMKGRKSAYPIPKDADLVRPIAEDFQHIFDLEPAEWWKQHGKYLFGVVTPKPDAFLAGRLNAKNPTTTVLWDKNDAVVVRLAANQSKKDALKAVGKLIDGLAEKGQFGQTSQKPKYTFMKSRLRESALAMGRSALVTYQMKLHYPLWWIGNFGDVSPAHTYSEDDVDRLGKTEIARRRRIISIATSRYVKYAMLVAENAARGRFPCVDPFPEAQLNLFQRTVGSPVGRKRNDSKRNLLDEAWSSVG